MGVHDQAPLTVREVLDMLAFDGTNPSSIVGSLGAARQNARGVREALSAEIWECLNTTDLELPRRVSAARQFGPAPFFTLRPPALGDARRLRHLDDQPGQRVRLPACSGAASSAST